MPEHCGRIDAEPAVEQRGIDLPKIDCHLEIALIEIGQRGVQADEAGADVWPGEKNRRCGAVVSAGGAVFFYAAAEFAECENDDAVVELGGFEVVQECFERVGQFVQELRMLESLRGMRVVAGLRDVIDARAAAEF